MKDVTTENNWTFDLDVGDGIDIPIYVIVGFMQRNQFNQQHQNIDTLCWWTEVKAQFTSFQMPEQFVFMLLINIHKPIEKLFTFLDI